MKKYLLLASVAGCLMANNAMAYSGNEEAEITVSVKLAQEVVWEARDVNFGNILVSGSAAANDIIATFTNGAISYTDGKTISHGSAESGVIALSAGSAVVSGVSFSAESVDLKDSENNVIARMVDIVPSTKTTVPLGDITVPGYYINGKLKLISVADYFGDRDTGVELSGTMTATLQF